MEKFTIKQIRIGLNMTQEEIATFLGISTISYQFKESGKRRFYFDEIKKICDKARVSLDAVII